MLQQLGIKDVVKILAFTLRWLWPVQDGNELQFVEGSTNYSVWWCLQELDESLIIVQDPKLEQERSNFTAYNIQVVSDGAYENGMKIWSSFKI